ncbi:uncharacterized protein LOC143584546 isoform X3 [Bidens hawaiensis]|uniref:uncharacterized protein LOC143584546 isoform X3 n=1 Tax=Bidens hawaiensis TaxID=980011 RepID=UPI004049CEEE
MESFSHSKKLSTQNPYDAVFNHPRRKFVGPSPIGVQDYREIFGGSQNSSIPVLDVSTLGTKYDSLSFNFADSGPLDYSKIFGGFCDESVAVSYQDLFGQHKLRKHSSKAPNSQDSDNLSHQSPDALKKFSMSYNKVNSKSKDGLDGTKHVTQTPAVTGFTCFVNEPVMEAKKQNPPAFNVKSSRNVVRRESNNLESVFDEPVVEAKKPNPSAVNVKVSKKAVGKESNHLESVFDEPVKEAKKPNPSAVNVKSSRKAVGKESNHLESVFNEPVMEAKKPNPSAVNVKSSRKAVEKESNHLESIFDDKKSRTFNIDFENHKYDQKRSRNLESSKPDFDEGVDVNSDASAALRKAIEKAQESIRIAKESVGRKKNGLRSFSNKKIQKSSKLEGEDSSQVFQDVDRNRKYGGTGALPNFMESEKLFVAKKFIDEISEKISESVKGSKFRDDGIACNEAVDVETSKIESTDFVNECQTDNMFVDEDEVGVNAVKPSIDISEEQLFVKEPESEENDRNDDVNRLDASVELQEDEKQENVVEHEEVENAESEKHEEFLEASERVKSESEPGHDTQENFVEHEEVDNAESEKLEEILEASEWVESENEPEHDKQENVLEHEVTENAKSDQHEEILEASERAKSENEPTHDKQENVFEREDSENAKSEKHEEILEASERVKSENEFGNDKQENVLEHEDSEYAESEKHDEILEASEWVESENESEHDQNSEETNETFDDFCEIDAKDSVQTFFNKLEENETKQEDDHTVETKGESLDESCDREFEEKSSSDDNIMEETDDIDYVHNASNNVVMDDINVETTQTASEDEDEYEVKSEEKYIFDNMADLGLDNDARPESSSDSSIQPPDKEITDTEKSNEVKGSQEPESRHKEDEVDESGPSKISQDARFNKIDEEATVKRRQWEKNRLAVDRAVREARERAFAEARERAERERAAVEKAKEEVRQRMVAEAHEKVSKASVEKAISTERAKLRAERAAVERATSEARQRALEKAISQKTASDLNRTESALRTKAKLEKHNRIMERAAKALAEKEKRDRLAQKEQAERNRLAESLDADIKRWSKGKEGNLRALLSTLQYILGPESGWQPVTLTEIITANAVKKAYRKATLCVHPDKLQQRGATIQQKYICEKVFDLLKAAWNRFNSEER